MSFLGIQMVCTLECFHCYVKPPPRYLLTFELSIPEKLISMWIFTDRHSPRPRSLSHCAPGLTGQTTSWWTAPSPPSAWPGHTGCTSDKVTGHSLRQIRIHYNPLQAVPMWWSESEAAPSRCTPTRAWSGASGGQWPQWWRRPTPPAASRTRSGPVSWPQRPSGATVTQTGEAQQCACEISSRQIMMLCTIDLK